MKKRKILKIFFISLVIIMVCSTCQNNGNEIFYHIQKQLSFGPRIPGSASSQFTSDYFRDFLVPYGWKVEFQEFEFNGVKLRNVIAKNSQNPPQLIIGTHYDTRQLSDRDPDILKQSIPVPGAIDGASGSAITLQLGKNIFKNGLSVWLVFFDGEDQGNINGWEWSIGAQYFVSKLLTIPKYVVILDMLGDKQLTIYKEKSSNINLSDGIWATANNLGYGRFFIDQQKYSMIDDHIPFINRGIPTTLLIDFDYPYWHTSSDTLDKVSNRNLSVVFDVMLNWINSLQ
jgi:glutaminyl-peptide cyclotransferase